MKKVILYINQFFAGVGGEDQADYEPAILEGPVGPGTMLQSELDGAQITHTIVCGDNFMNSHRDEAIRRIDGFLEGKSFDLLLAGPAFQSGRYGMSCGEMCKHVSQQYHVPVVTSMNPENPGVDAYRDVLPVYIMKGNKSAAKMRADAKAMARLANKLLAGEEILWADAEGYFGHGVRRECFVEQTATDRAVDMLLKKIAGEPYETEYKIEVHDAVAPAKAVEDIRTAKIALITTGGMVPVGNPDRMPSGTASVWKKYPIGELESFQKGAFYSVHGGFSTDFVNEDPEVLVPLASVRELVAEGKLGEIEPFLYSTTGNLTALKDARRMGEEIAKDLRENQVSAAVLVST